MINGSASSSAIWRRWRRSRAPARSAGRRASSATRSRRSASRSRSSSSAVGQRLVDRPGGPRRVDLTEAGRLLLRHADAIVAQLDAAQADMAALAEGAAGPLRVGIYQSVGARILPGLLRRFQREWPRVEVRVQEETDAADLLRLVEHGELDLTFADLPLPPGPFESAEVLQDPYVLLVSAKSELAARDTAPPLRELAGAAADRVAQQRRARALPRAATSPSSTSSSAPTTTARSSASSPRASAPRSCRGSSSTRATPRSSALPFGSRIPPRVLAIVVAPRPLPLGRVAGVRRAGAGARRGLRRADQRTVQRCGGQYVATTGPMNADRSTGPHVRESHDSIRLSPIMKYSFFPSRGHAFVTESRSHSVTYGSDSFLPSM